MMDTPVSAVWEPRLAQRSLPNGLPLPDEDRTLFSANAERVLLLGDPTEPFLELYLSQPTGMLTGRRLLTVPPITGVIDVNQRVIRYQLTTNGITGAVSVPAPSPASVVHGAIESVKDKLGIDWGRLLSVLDLRVRTFHTHRKTGSLPSMRLPDLHARVNVLERLANYDVTATRTLLALRADEVRSAFDRADYSSVEALFQRVRHELAEADIGGRSPLADATAQLDAVATVVNLPGFETAARAFGELRGEHVMARLSALIEVARAVDAGHEGGDVDQRWDFLPTLTHAEMDDLSERARELIAASTFTPDIWTEFVMAEAARAWDGYSPTVLPPDPAEPLFQVEPPYHGWAPDLSSYGVPTHYTEPGSR
jgi:hypothetical protein